MKQKHLSFTRIPKDFQKDLFIKISDILKKGESLQLYGVSGSGNSLIAKAIVQSSEIRTQYFDNNHRFLLLDANMLLERSSLGLCRFLMTILSEEHTSLSNTSVLYSEIDGRITKICKESKLTLIIDHATELSTFELKPFFTNLYETYRKLEPKLNFIFIFNKKVESNDEVSKFGNIGRLIVQNIIRNEVLSKDDALWFISEKEAQMDMKLNHKSKNKIYEISGGFPRTIKRLVESLGKHTLHELEACPSIDFGMVSHFEELINLGADLPEIPILEIYLKNKENLSKGEEIKGLKFVNKLTKNEEKLLKIFLEYEGKIIKREDGIEKLWGIKSMDVSDHAYDQIILRLRGKLKKSSVKGEIETVRGRGHFFKLSR